MVLTGDVFSSAALKYEERAKGLGIWKYQFFNMMVIDCLHIMSFHFPWVLNGLGFHLVVSNSVMDNYDLEVVKQANFRVLDMSLAGYDCCFTSLMNMTSLTLAMLKNCFASANGRKSVVFFFSFFFFFFL